MPPRDEVPAEARTGGMAARLASAATAALGETVSADLEALRNDVDQARELASDYQRQLAGKSNEFASLKEIFEKTKNDLIHLHQGITELRRERHRLANEAMKVTALEFKLARVTEERDRLAQENLTLRKPARSPEPAAPASSALPPAAEYIAMRFDDDAAEHPLTVVPNETDPSDAARKLRKPR